MSLGPIRYRLPGATWILEFSPAAVEVIGRHVQRQWRSRESVGQLYSRDLVGDRVVVSEATVLSPIWAAWAKVRFDTEKAARERQALFQRGMHCIGLWHSHPEPSPQPSLEDRALARDHALAAQGQLTGIVFAIVGTLPLPAGLRVWIDDRRDLTVAESVTAVGAVENGGFDERGRVENSQW